MKEFKHSAKKKFINAKLKQQSNVVLHIISFIIAGVNILNYILLEEDIRMDTFIQILKYIAAALGYAGAVAAFLLKHFIDKKISEKKYAEEQNYAEVKKNAEEASEVSGCKDGETKLNYAFNICKNAIQAYKYFKLTDEEIIEGINKDIDLTKKVNVASKQQLNNTVYR